MDVDDADVDGVVVGVSSVPVFAALVGSPVVAAVAADDWLDGAGPFGPGAPGSAVPVTEFAQPATITEAASTAALNGIFLRTAMADDDRTPQLSDRRSAGPGAVHDLGQIGYRAEMPTNGQRPGNVWRRSGPGLVAFLFGAADSEELPATLLVRLLGDLGISEASARTVLSRLRQAGFLAARTEGRRVQLRLAGVGAAAFVRGRDSSEAAIVPPWDGVLHGILYTLPESHRSFRDALRRTAVLAGYGALRPGLLVCPFDRWESVLAASGPPPANTTVYPVALTMDPKTAATAAAEAWELTAIAEEFSASIQLLRSLPDVPAGVGADAFRMFVRTLRPIYQSFIRDPALPAELVGPDWPLRALAQELQLVLRRWHPPIARYIADLTGADST